MPYPKYLGRYVSTYSHDTVMYCSYLSSQQPGQTPSQKPKRQSVIIHQISNIKTETAVRVKATLCVRPCLGK